MKKHIGFFLLIFFYSASFTGCRSGATPIATSTTQTIEVIPTPNNPIPTQKTGDIPTTINPASTRVTGNTPISVIPTSTQVTSTQLDGRVTPTSEIPMYSFKQARSFILDNIENNGDCELPCIWGITPGIEKEQVKSYFARFNSFIGSNIGYPTEYRIHSSEHSASGGISIELINEEGKESVDFSYYLVENRLDQLVLYSEFFAGMNEQYTTVFGHPMMDQLMHFYMPANILSTYGAPTEILFAARNLEPMDEPGWKEPFTIALYYPEKGFLMQYIGHATQNTGSHLEICPNSLAFQLTTWDVSSHLSLSDVIERGNAFTLSIYTIDYFKPIDEVTNITTEKFFSTYRKSDNETCFETPVELWNP